MTVAIDRTAAEPAYLQLYRQFRDLILNGRLAPGARLPSSRGLAADIGVSRTTTLAAYDHLRSEGYLDAHAGSGMFVPPALPEALLNRKLPHRSGGPAPETPPAEGVPSLSGRPFDPGAPDADRFPAAEWARLLARTWRRPDSHLLHDRGQGGLPALRAAIAGHLRAMRGIECGADQVIVTAGVGEAIALLGRALGLDSRLAWVEDPGYRAVRDALGSAGLEAAPILVDDDGFDVDLARRLRPGAGLAVVTPSRQFPLGTTMSLSRRLALLDWARGESGWIVEDDYDSEYRYAGRPQAALMSLDDGERVVYVGSFSKVMFRALRLGYLVAPPRLAERVLAARRSLGAQASTVAQPALAAFIADGRFASHIRRMRRLYAERQQALVASVGRELEGRLTAPPQDGGMHLVAYLTDELAARMSDVEAAARAAGAGIMAPALSRHYAESPPRQGLLLGFACASPDALGDATRRLAGVLAAAGRPN
ncbi:MAG: PLP-dependent aminotransferase family protein [Alphaproteobacteria bacterium]|nr:PLP-dependent aminotransferase family protein [Alphaproteobacteria bacterium]